MLVLRCPPNPQLSPKTTGFLGAHSKTRNPELAIEAPGSGQRKQIFRTASSKPLAPAMILISTRMK
jgi:hypothetical protein